MSSKFKKSLKRNQFLNWIKRSWLTLIVVALLGNFAYANMGLAMQAPSGVPHTFETFGEGIRTIFNVVILIAGIAFVVLFLVGGIQYLTAAGNEDTTKKASKLLIDALVGLVIVLAAWAIGGWIIKQLTGEQLQGEFDY